MPRPTNTQERREAIALALARVMARTGYDRASIGAIAAEAGVAAGGVHYHFSSKAEILEVLVARLVGVAEDRTAGRMAIAGTPRDRVAALLDGLLALEDDSDPHAVAVWSLVAAEAVRNADVRGIYAGWLAHASERLHVVLAAVCADEGRSDEGTHRLAAGLVALV